MLSGAYVTDMDHFQNSPDLHVIAAVQIHCCYRQPIAAYIASSVCNGNQS